MTAFLIDEMFPPNVAVILREKYGHDAVHVSEVGLQAADDALVASAERAEGRRTRPGPGVRPEEEPPPGDGQAAALAKALDRWAHDQPDAYLGPHWPQVLKPAAHPGQQPPALT